LERRSLRRWRERMRFSLSSGKKDQMETLGLKTAVDGENVSINPQHFFQRLFIIANNSDLPMHEVLLLKYDASRLQGVGW